jgi:HD-like signal output (HDOD) protein
VQNSPFPAGCSQVAADAESCPGSATEIAALLNSDPALSAEVLTAANRAAYEAARRITTTARAIAILGTERTKALAARAALDGMLRKIGESAAVRNCWVHSRAVSVIAEWLSPCYRIHPDRAYTIGLLHDIGRLGLLSLDAQTYSSLLDTTTGTNELVLETERRVFQVDHCEAGGWLTKTWGMAEEFQTAASQHHARNGGTTDHSFEFEPRACALAQAFGYRAAPLVAGPPIESILDGLPEIARPADRIAALFDHLEQEVGFRPPAAESNNGDFLGKSHAA